MTRHKQYCYLIFIYLFLPFMVRAEEVRTKPSVAILPFENMSERFLSLDELMQPFYQNLSNIYSIPSFEDVDKIILRLRVRHTGFLTSQDTKEIGRRLGVDAIILGMICEYEDFPNPRMGLIIKMISTGEGTPIIWMKSAFASGSIIKEWFGKKYISKTGSLIEGIVKDMAKDMPINLLLKDDDQ